MVDCGMMKILSPSHPLHLDNTITSRTKLSIRKVN